MDASTFYDKMKREVSYHLRFSVVSVIRLRQNKAASLLLSQRLSMLEISVVAIYLLFYGNGFFRFHYPLVSARETEWITMPEK